MGPTFAMLLIVALFVWLGTGVWGGAPVVETPYGRVEGFEYALRNGEKANVFLGIPYAKPPVGELRLEHPQKLDKWTEVKEAKEFAAACHGHHLLTAKYMEPEGTEFSEDCLFLNVIAPAKKSSDPNGFPVFVFIHGGGFEFGSSNFYGFKNVSENFVSQGIVFVSLNYRLSAFGFFSTGDVASPGNLGLWDQTLALQFIQETISRFGGDPDRVTISGESAGGASVSALSFSPHLNRLFQQVIAMSGSLYAGWATHEAVVEESLKLAETLKCEGDSYEILDCMKTKRVDEIHEAIEKNGCSRDDLLTLVYNPRLDGEFFPYDFETMLRKAPKIPMVTGVTDTEGGFMSMLENIDKMILTSVPRSKWKTYSAEDLKTYIEEKSVGEHYGKAGEFLKAKMVEFYVDRPKEGGGEMNATDYLDRLTLLYSDIYFNVPAYQEAMDKSAKDVPVFLYSEDYFNPAELNALKIPVKGSYHGNEIPYIFGVSFGVKIEFNEDDWKFQKDLLEGFTSFIKTGKPTIRGKPWKAISANHLDRFMSFTPKSEMKKGFKKESMDFWLKDVAKNVDLNVVRKALFPATKKPVSDRVEL
ncbi:hypothetical protein L596_015751 [Steinernema carpocapsae]|uniref:Carboxylic ester hydrolase n=1 Tax=Steinernema carpocapsae TaxID=34508 RepID=A0A4U5NGW3_STECR|nr:hypothetical protein L596_015751 [Steinernema carpocapsae]